MDRFAQQIEFLKRIGQLVTIIRQTLIVDGSRRENDAEHSWHMATAAILLQEYASEEIDLCRTIELALVHDLIEIDAGDTYAYDPAANVGREQRERLAADKLFGMLPDDQALYFRGLWDEFEVRQTPEARFAAALDRVQSVILNYTAGGQSWVDHGVTADQVRQRIAPVKDGSPKLWNYLNTVIDDSQQRGWLR